MDHKDNLNPPEETRPEEAEEEEYQEEEENDEVDEVDDEHQTRKTRSGKAYNMHFHTSYQTMSWYGPQLDLNTTSEAMTQQKSAAGKILPIPPHGLLKSSRQRTLSEQLLCITHYSR